MPTLAQLLGFVASLRTGAQIAGDLADEIVTIAAQSRCPNHEFRFLREMRTWSLKASVFGTRKDHLCIWSALGADSVWRLLA